jgi:hypothetical protein
MTEVWLMLDRGVAKRGRNAMASSKKKSARREKVIEISLTAEQQAKLRADTNGRIDAATLKLRPTIDIVRIVESLTGLKVSRAVSTGAAPPPKGEYWVSASA